MRKLILVAILSVISTGCLLKETSHTLYLRPDGAVTWSVLERDIRSDEADPDKRRSEEEAYLAAVAAGEHDVAKALDVLGAQWVEVLQERISRAGGAARRPPLRGADPVSEVPEVIARRLDAYLDLAVALWSTGRRSATVIAREIAAFLRRFGNS